MPPRKEQIKDKKEVKDMRASEKTRGIMADKKKILLISVTVMMCAVCLFTLFMYVRSFLPVTRFELSGVTRYDRAEIIGHSGIKMGDKLYDIDLDKAEEALLENCPYLEEVSVEREFPNRIVFRVIEKIPQWYIEVSGDYYSLDTNFLVIEETTSKEAFVNGGVPQLVLPNLKSLICGELPEFGADDTEIKKALELVAAVQSSTLKSRLTLVDMESRFDVNIVVDGKYNVYMGDISNIEEKLTAIEKILKSDRLKDYAGADIDASIPETISVKPIYQ